MSTSPDLAGPRLVETSGPVVYSPIPVLRSASGSNGQGQTDPAPAAAGYAAGWAQGVAAAAVNERRALAEVAAVAAAQREDFAARTHRALAALADAAQAMRVRTAPDVDATADSLAGAAIDLAEVVLGAEIADDTSGRRGRTALTRALAGLPEHQQVIVRLHPADLAAVQDLTGSTEVTGAAGPAGTAGADTSDPLAGRRGVQLHADPRLAPGDAVADFPGGSVDARIASALERMRAALRAEERS